MKTNTMSQLANGKVIVNGDHKVIIGDTDVIAFTDSFGDWQYAENVNWQDAPANLDHLLRRKRINDVISKHFPEGTADEFYSESSENAVVIDNHGHTFHVFPDGTVQNLR